MALSDLTSRHLDSEEERHLRDREEERYYEQVWQASQIQFPPHMEFLPNRDAADHDQERLREVHKLLEGHEIVKATLDTRHRHGRPGEPFNSPWFDTWKLDVVSTTSCFSYIIDRGTCAMGVTVSLA